MNKNEFLYTLKQHLVGLDQEQTQEILADFEEHFANGLQQGKSEQELAQELGDPGDIGRQYQESLAEGQSHQAIRSSWQETTYVHAQRDVPPESPDDTSTKAKPEEPASGSINEGMLILMIVLGLFITLPVASSLIGVLIGFWSAAGGIGIAAFIVLAVAILEGGMISLILFLTFLSLLSLSILVFMLSYYLTKLFILAIKCYFRWNKKLVTGGDPT